LRLAGLRPQESQVLLALNDSIGTVLHFVLTPVATDLSPEFIISDLALASHSIRSFTISSPALISLVLESHSPTAIITHAQLLPEVLELIYDAGNRTSNHTIIVVGEPSPRAMASVASTIKVLKFADVEREGVRVEKSISPLPSACDHCCDFYLQLNFDVPRSF
jgi:long-chain acyl-CoA synthetase